MDVNHVTNLALQKKLPAKTLKATCSRSVGIVYKLGNKSLISFKDNYCLLGDLLFVVYFDFETTLGKDLFQDKKCTF